MFPLLHLGTSHILALHCFLVDKKTKNLLRRTKKQLFVAFVANSAIVFDDGIDKEYCSCCSNTHSVEVNQITNYCNILMAGVVITTIVINLQEETHGTFLEMKIPNDSQSKSHCEEEETELSAAGLSDPTAIKKGRYRRKVAIIDGYMARRGGAGSDVLRFLMRWQVGAMTP